MSSRIIRLLSYRVSRRFLHGHNVASRHLIASPKSISVFQPKVQFLPMSTKTSEPANPKNDFFRHLLTNKSTRGRVARSVLEKAMQIPQLRPAQLVTLLECCGDSLPYESLDTRRQLQEKIWALAKGKVNESLALAYLRACRENRVPVKGGDFLKRHGLQASQTLLEAILAVAGECGDVEEQTRVLELMDGDKMALDQKVFGLIALGFSRAKRLDQIKVTIETMNVANVAPEADFYTELIKAQFENGESRKALKLFEEKALLLSLEQMATVVRAAVNHFEDLKGVLKFVSTEMVQHKLIHPLFRNICSELVVEREFDRLNRFISALPVPQFTTAEDHDGYGSFILREMIVHPDVYEPLLRFCRLLKESGRNTYALYVALEMSLRFERPYSIDLLAETAKVITLRPHYFWPLLVQASRESGEGGVLETIKLMTSYKVEPDSDTIEHYIMPRLSITIQDAETAIKTLEAVGLQTNQFMSQLVVQLLHQKRFNEMMTITGKYQTKISPELLVGPLVLAFTSDRGQEKLHQLAQALKRLQEKSSNTSYDLCGHLLTAIVENRNLRDDWESILALIGELALHRVRISRSAAGFVEQHLLKYTTEAKDCFEDCVDTELEVPTALTQGVYVHPREMDMEQLECHLQQLEAKQMNPRGVLRRLLQMYVRHGRTEQALETMARCERENVYLSAGMQASIFELFTKVKDVDQAEKAYEDLIRLFPGFKVDEFKVINYATLLVENDRLKDAKKVLEARAKMTRIKGGDNCRNNINQLLHAVVARSKGAKNEAGEMLEFLIQLGYAQYTRTTCGAVIDEYLKKNELEAAIAAFKDFCQQQKVVPSLYSLAALLIRLSNAETPENEFLISKAQAQQLLQDVITTATQTRGKQTVNAILLVAFAESGTERQLRRLLLDPNSTFLNSQLISDCRWLCQIGKIDVVYRLARGARGLRQPNEQELYEIILEQLTTQNNADGALWLYTRIMEDDEYKVSTTFATKLGALLEKNHLQVPTALKQP